MNRKLVLTLIAMSTACLIGIAHADKQDGKRGGPERHLQRLTQELQLSEDQATEVQAIMEQHRSEMDGLRETGQRPDRATRQAHRASLETKLSAVLSEQQLARFQEMKPPRRGRHGGQRGETGEAQGPE